MTFSPFVGPLIILGISLHCLAWGLGVPDLVNICGVELTNLVMHCCRISAPDLEGGLGQSGKERKWDKG